MSDTERDTEQDIEDGPSEITRRLYLASALADDYAVLELLGRHTIEFVEACERYTRLLQSGGHAAAFEELFKRRGEK